MSNPGYYLNVRHDGTSAWLKPLGAPQIELDDSVAKFVWNVSRFGPDVAELSEPSAARDADTEELVHPAQFSIYISKASLFETTTENRVDLDDPVKARAFLGLVKNSARRTKGQKPTSAPTGLTTALTEMGF